ncbi:unnamed protein product [Musa banksii]
MKVLLYCISDDVFSHFDATYHHHSFGTNLHRHLNVVGSHLQYRTRRTNYICL